MKGKLLDILKFILPCIFISYMAGISFFMHTHIINGVTIVHSHPFDKDVTHEHNTSEIELIHSFNSSALTDDITDSYFEGFYPQILSVFDNFIAISEIPLIIIRVTSLRAPPVI